MVKIQVLEKTVTAELGRSGEFGHSWLESETLGQQSKVRETSRVR